MKSDLLTIVLRTLRNHKIAVIVYCALSVIFIWMYVAIFPTIQAQASTYTELIKAFPKELMAAFGMSSFSMMSLSGFLATEQFGFVWPFMMFMLVIAFGSATLAGEIDSGTMELLLAQPISRIKLFFGKYIAGLIIITLFTIFSVLVVIPFAQIYKITIDSGGFVTLFIATFLLSLTTHSITMLFSAIFSDKGRVAFVVSGILTIMFVLNIVASLKESLANLKYLSFFYYYNPSEALLKNSLSFETVFVFVAVSIICTILGALWFNKRDVAV